MAGVGEGGVLGEGGVVGAGEGEGGGPSIILCKLP